MTRNGEERRAEAPDFARLHEDMVEIKATLKDIFKILNGNGQEGLITKVAINRSSINRVWWWLSAISLSIAGAAIACIKEYVQK
jgi:hypothetical protein